MSLENALAFIASVEKSPELQAEINLYSGAGVLKRLVALGEAHGYGFTEDEYREAVVQLADGELSDEALEEVLRETGLQK